MIKSLDSIHYRPSVLHDGWKYRQCGTTVIGLNKELNQMISHIFPDIKSARAELLRLTGKKRGRPAYGIHPQSIKGIEL